MISLVMAGLMGYLVGSIPWAFLIVKQTSRVDIRLAGSGNVGALNSFLVTNSRRVGALVLLLDLLKGVVAVVMTTWLLSPEFVTNALAGLSAVLGHNYPLWLGFHGGRGLATAAGVMLLLGVILLPIWCALWFIGFRLSKDSNVGNAVATVLIGVLVLVQPPSILQEFLRAGVEPSEFKIFVLLLVVLILVRLVQPVQEYRAARKAADGKIIA